jgi:hypothetical protein
MSKETPPEDRISDEEWLKRYDARITECGGFEGSYSETTGVKETLEMFRAPDECFDNYPEDAADEEMSYWEGQ